MDKSASGKVDLVAVDGDDELYNAIANAFDLSYWQNDEFNVQLGFNGKANFGVVDNEAGRVGIMKPFRNNFRADLDRYLPAQEGYYIGQSWVEPKDCDPPKEYENLNNLC